jgi:hypothetical protein
VAGFGSSRFTNSIRPSASRPARKFLPMAWYSMAW